MDDALEMTRMADSDMELLGLDDMDTMARAILLMDDALEMTRIGVWVWFLVVGFDDEAFTILDGRVVKKSICLDSERTWAIAWTEEKLGVEVEDVFPAKENDAKLIQETSGKLFDNGHMVVVEDIPVEG